LFSYIIQREDVSALVTGVFPHVSLTGDVLRHPSNGVTHSFPEDSWTNGNRSLLFARTKSSFTTVQNVSGFPYSSRLPVIDGRSSLPTKKSEETLQVLRETRKAPFRRTKRDYKQTLSSIFCNRLRLEDLCFKTQRPSLVFLCLLFPLFVFFFREDRLRVSQKRD